MQKNKKSESGQSLFEAILALAVFVITVATIAHLFLGAHYSAAHSVEKAQAVLLAKEGIEAVRSMRDDDFGNIEEKTADGIELVLAKWQFKGEPDTTEKFTRTINIIVSPRDLEAWQIESVITWTSVTGKEAEVSFVEDLTAWRLSPWISLDWDYRKPTTIDNTLNASALTDYQVLVTLDTASLITAGKMRSDCGDIRFADSDGSTLINYWLESGCDSASTKIWVNVPSIPASSTATIYLYYGNSTETSTGDGNTTFDFFDDFSDESINSSKWAYSGTITESGGVIRIDPGRLQSIVNHGSSFIFESRSRVTSTTYAWSGHIAMAIMDSNQADGYGFWPFYRNTNTWHHYWRGNGSWTSIEDSGSWTTNQWYRHTVYRDGVNFKWDIDGVNRYNGDHPDGASLANTSYIIAPRVWTENNGDGSGPIEFEWVAVRQYASPEPTTEVGAEESF